MEDINSCRCCLMRSPDKHLHSEYTRLGQTEIYAEMLKECFEIHLSFEDDNECGICEICVSRLRDATDFKLQVQRCQVELQERLTRPHGFKGEDTKVKVEISDEEDDNGAYILQLKEEMSDYEELKDGGSKLAELLAFEHVTVKRKRSGGSKQGVGWKARRTMITQGPRGSKDKPSKTKLIVIRPKTEKPRKKRCKIIEIKPTPAKVSFKKLNEAHKHQANLKEILLCSNATPIRCRGSVGYSCCFCSEQYRDPAELKQHTISSHDDTTKANYMKGESIVGFIVKLDITSLRCNICSSTIRELGQLMEHLKTAHNRPILTDLKNHLVPFRFESNMHSCVECSSEFSNFKVLLAHMNEHYRNCICEICGAGFVTKRILQAHSYRHITGEFSCRYCSKVFDAKLRMQEHERNVHILMNRRNKCGYCGEKFTDYTKKNDHEVKVHGVKPIVLHCQACTKTFDNQRSLTVHTKTFHLMQRKTPKASNPLKL